MIVVPPHYDYYVKFSKMIQKIYARYTDEIEPFGMDECWLDVTHLPMKPMEIAERIRCGVKDELALTVSIGVSFNKVFAKIGSLAVDALFEGKSGEMVTIYNAMPQTVSLEKILGSGATGETSKGGSHNVDPNGFVVKTDRNTGISFGD